MSTTPGVSTSSAVSLIGGGHVLVAAEWFEQVDSGTAGTVTVPQGGTVVLGRFGGGVDAVVSGMAGGFPDYTQVTTAGGTVVTTTINAAGDYVLSGTPSSFPVAVIYAYTVIWACFDYTKSLGGFEFVGTLGVESIDGQSGAFTTGNSVTSTARTLDTIQDIRVGAVPTFEGMFLTESAPGGVIFAGVGGVMFQDEANFFYDNTNNRLGIGTKIFTQTVPGVNVAGNVEITHTAAATDDHALEINIDAAGFAGVNAIAFAYDTGVLTAGNVEAVNLVSIDESDATGGDIVGLTVLSTEGLATPYGMLAGVTVNPIVQLSGTFDDADTILVLAVDQTTALSSGGAGNISIFILDNDTVTIGDAAKYQEIEFILDTVASGSGIAPTFEFSTGVGTWSAFTPTDGTSGMRNNGVIQFMTADIPSWAVGTGSEFLIRITRTRNSLGTTPIADLVQISASTQYMWDATGDVSVNSLTAASLTPGSVLFSGIAGLISEDNTNLFWDDSLNRLGIGTDTPPSKLTVEDGGPDVVRIISTSGSNDARIVLASAGATSNAARISGVTNGTNVDIALVTGGSERMRVRASGQVGIGIAVPVTSALLDLTSTTGALMLPRMTTTQRDALTQAAGMMIYNTTTTNFEGYDGTSWVTL